MPEPDMLTMMRATRNSLLPLLLATLLVAGLAGCGGSAAKKDARRLGRKCGLVQGNPVTADDARCIARLWGLKSSDNCPIEVELIEGYAEPVYRVHECEGLGLLVSGSTGRVLAVVSGDDVVYPPPP